MTKLYNYLIKNGDALAVGVSALLLIIFAIGVYMGAQSGGYNLNDLLEREDVSDVNAFNSGLYMMIIMTILAIVLMLLGIFTDLFKNFKSGSKTLIGFGLLIGVFIALYFTSSHDTGGRFDAYWSPEFKISEGISKFISAGLYSVGALTVVSFLLIIFYEVKGFFKT